MTRFRALACAAALSLAAVPAASAAQDSLPGYTPSALETSMAGFEARMTEFGDRAEAIADDDSLTEAEQEARILALWAEYSPELTAMTGAAAEFGVHTAGTILSNVDIDGMISASLASADIEIAEAMAEVDIEAEVARALAGVDIDAEVARALAEADIEGSVAEAMESLEDLDIDVEIDADET